MTAVSDLFGQLITGATTVLSAQAVAKSDANAIEEQRAAVAAANARTQAAQSSFQQAQDFINNNLSKTVSFLMGTVALTLIGVIIYNIRKR